jgi:hypothetical protein
VVSPIVGHIKIRNIGHFKNWKYPRQIGAFCNEELPVVVNRPWERFEILLTFVLIFSAERAHVFL